MRPALQHGWYSQCHRIEEINIWSFPLPGHIVNKSFVRNGVFVDPLYLLNFFCLIWTCAGLVHSICLREFITQPYCVWNIFFLTIFLLAFPHRSLSLERRIWIKIPLLGLRSPNSLTLCTLYNVIFLSCHLTQEENFLLTVEWCIDLWIYQHVISSFLISMSI